MKRRVVITGVGAITPLGNGADTLVDRWVDGQVGLQDGIGRCWDFDPGDVLTKKEARRTDRYTQLAVVAAEEAIAQAGLDGAHEPDRVGCVIGTGIGGMTTIETQHDVLRERGEKAVSILGIPMMMANAAPAAIAMRHGFAGPNFGTFSACAAGAHALGTAVRLIQVGDVDAMVTGGSESALASMSTIGFAAMGATSRCGISRPFDARRDGFVLGEGAGMLVLEEAEAAAARGAVVLGEVLGVGASADAFHLTAPRPTGEAAARAITRALDDAGLTPDEVDYVNAHGTSTELNDRAETEALKRALGPAAHRVPISSTKSAVGHLLGAGGAVEAVAMVLSLGRRIAPPTLGYEEPEEGLDLDYVPGRARPLEIHENGSGPRRAIGISNSFGFGGHNSVVCLAA